jgi:hypothetical protein
VGDGERRQPKDVISFRLPADLVAALRQKATENGETLTDLLRRGALLEVGICPTCNRPMSEPAEATMPPA